MTAEGEEARLVVVRVRRARARKAAIVVAAVLTTAAVLASVVGAGILSLPLHGLPLDEDQRWIIEVTQSEALQAMGYDGTGVTICLVDTGVDLLHPDLGGVLLVSWEDLVNGEELPYDDGGHGTAMAGLVFAQGRLRGVAPGASLIAVKALRANGTGSSEDVGKAIRFCLDPDRDGDPADGADIISLSLGAQATPFTTNAAARAAEEAMAQGVFVVSSAGNDGREDDGDVSNPANEPLVFSVGSLNDRLEIAAFSSKGNNTARLDPHWKPEFVLPGVGLTTTGSGSSYGAITGTSASAALLSGLLALLLQAHPEFRHASQDAVLAVKQALVGTSLPLEGQATPHDDWYGYGLVQLGDAHTRLSAG